MIQSTKAYFEFNDHEYYGLVTVRLDYTPSVEELEEKAIEVYGEAVTGESVNEVFAQGRPRMVSEHYAISKLAESLGNEGDSVTVNELLKQFHNTENTCILVDSSLVL